MELSGNVTLLTCVIMISQAPQSMWMYVPLPVMSMWAQWEVASVKLWGRDTYCQASPGWTSYSWKKKKEHFGVLLFKDMKGVRVESLTSDAEIFSCGVNHLTAHEASWEMHFCVVLPAALSSIMSHLQGQTGRQSSGSFPDGLAERGSSAAHSRLRSALSLPRCLLGQLLLLLVMRSWLQTEASHIQWVVSKFRDALV